MVCTRCEGSGFLNLHQVNESILKEFDEFGPDVILNWMANHEDSDVQRCDCCGNGDDAWYGEPGRHYTGGQDPRGMNGPYAYNGGLAECH